MAKLAIKGHPLRGKGVIEILEMLGGINTAHFDGENTGLAYYIEVDKSICCIDIETEYHKGFYKITLEEFLEKFPYEVGDKVSSKYLKNYKIEKMEWDATNNKVIYKLQGMGWYSVDELQPYKEETFGECIEKTINECLFGKEEPMEESNDKANKVVFEANAQSCDIMNDIIKEDMKTITIDDFKANTKEWLIDKLGNMSMNDALQTINNIYNELHKPKYPKTYEECCEVLGIGSYFEPEIRNATTKECHIFTKFIRLKRCRDAYWKIAGEQMGLGKPWEPDWLNIKQDKYVLFTHNNVICSNRFVLGHNILAFPTEEMRDAFYENFKEEIETCKEFL